MHSKLNFTTRENTYKQFQEEAKSDILMGTICLWGTRITLTQTRQIIIINLDYNACSSNQVKINISRIGQFNRSTANIFISTNITIEQQIRNHYDKCQQIQNMTMKKAWVSGYKNKLNIEIK